MLPSSGAFREIDCPHHDAICGRPYCHFRHRSKKKAIHSIDSVEDSADNSNSSNDVPTYNPTPKSQLASARGHLPISYVPDLVIRTDRSSSRPPITMPKIEYKPTPKSILSSTTKANRSEYVPSPVRKDKINIEPTEIANAVDNIDLEDLDTEFGLIDEILSDGSFIEEKNNSKEVLDKKVEEVTKKSSTSTKSSNKDSKKSKERNSKDNSSKSRRKERDKDKDKSSISTKDNKEAKDNKDSKDKKNVKSNKAAKDNKDVRDKKERDKKTVSKSDKTSKHQSKSVSTSKSKHKTSSNSKLKDKDHKSSKDKHKSSKSGHESSKSSINTKSKKSSISSKNTPEENLHNLLDSNDSTDVNIDYSNIDLDIEEEDDDPTLEEECYRIFNEYKPTPIAELEKNPPVDEKYVPEDIATIGKKRIAYENAEKMTTNKLPPLTDRNKPVVPSPAQTMLNRIKQARMAQSNNEQNNIMTELKRQQEELHFKRNKETSAAENVSLVRAKIDRRNSTEQNIITSDLMRQYEEIKLKRSRESSAADLKKNKMAKTGIGANCNLNGHDLIVASKIKNRIAHQSTDLIDDILSGRSKPRKIAPVLNVNSIQKAKERVEQLKTLTQPPKTSAQTSFKTPRVAHVPDYSLSELPDVTHALKSKLAVNVRTRYLTMFADETVKLYLSRDDAYNRAVGEEDKCYERCSALPTYRNCAMLSINRLRKEVKERVASGLGPLESGEADREEADDQGLGGERLYGLLDKYRMGEEELQLHGFPMASPEPGRAQIKLKPNSACSLPSNQRICARCKKVYLIDKKGFPQYEEECIYHPLKKRTLRGDRTYLCCKSPDDAGCVTSNTHVSEVSEDRVLLGYQTTLPPSTTSDPRSHAIYALDCEMCYTTIGLELTRVTIVDPQMKTVYESLVKPLNQILDYNTQFSGITHDQMERTSTNILQVQANILHLCNSNTILIGHSLESDLKALKIIHSSVVDTSVMFPHKFGLPHKRALKALASDFLRKIIQNSVSGHDSAEDALTCMELVMWKVKEDLKVKGISASSLTKKR